MERVDIQRGGGGTTKPEDFHICLFRLQSRAKPPIGQGTSNQSLKARNSEPGFLRYQEGSCFYKGNWDWG